MEEELDKETEVGREKAQRRPAPPPHSPLLPLPIAHLPTHPTPHPSHPHPPPSTVVNPSAQHRTHTPPHHNHHHRPLAPTHTHHAHKHLMPRRQDPHQEKQHLNPQRSRTPTKRSKNSTQRAEIHYHKKQKSTPRAKTDHQEKEKTPHPPHQKPYPSRAQAMLHFTNAQRIDASCNGPSVPPTKKADRTPCPPKAGGESTRGDGRISTAPPPPSVGFHGSSA